MNTLYAIDGWILDKFERFSHWTQRNFGIKSSSLQRLALTAKLACLLILYQQQAWQRSVLTILIILGTLVEFAYSFIQENYKTANFANPMKYIGLGTRLLYVSVACVDAWLCYIHQISPTLWWECGTIAVYFAACDDLPPGESRLKQFVNSLQPLEPINT